MNAAFLLVTTAWFAGDCGPAPCSAPACDTCSKPKLCDKLHDLFKRKDCCEPCKTCAAPACAPAPKCAPACDSCGKPKLLDRLKAAFHRDKGCCEPACDTCNTCGSAAPAMMPKTGEPIPTPPAKKMPSGKTPPAKTQLESQPSAIPFAPAIEAVPNAIQAPAAIPPSVESENLRNPF